MQYWHNGDKKIRLDLKYGDARIIFSGSGSPQNPPLINLIPNEGFHCDEISLMRKGGQVVQTLRRETLPEDLDSWANEFILWTDYKIDFSRQLASYYNGQGGY